MFVCSCSSNDKYNAVSDYLEKVVSKSTEEKIILKEKIDPNETIYIFKDSNNDNRVSKTDVKEGDVIVDTVLYNERDWEKMSKKYGNKTPFIPKTYLPEKNNWRPSNFRFKKIKFENKDNYYDSFFNGKDYSLFEKKRIYIFSEPIYYKEKEYVAFTVSYADFSGIYSTFVVVMKKIKGKWVQKYYISPPWHS